MRIHGTCDLCKSHKVEVKVINYTGYMRLICRKGCATMYLWRAAETAVLEGR
jgi:hypothetical protein